MKETVRCRLDIRLEKLKRRFLCGSLTGGESWSHEVEPRPVSRQGRLVMSWRGTRETKKRGVGGYEISCTIGLTLLIFCSGSDSVGTSNIHIVYERYIEHYFGLRNIVTDPDAKERLE